LLLIENKWIFGFIFPIPHTNYGPLITDLVGKIEILLKFLLKLLKVRLLRNVPVINHFTTLVKTSFYSRKLGTKMLFAKLIGNVVIRAYFCCPPLPRQCCVETKHECITSTLHRKRRGGEKGRKGKGKCIILMSYCVSVP